MNSTPAKLSKDDFLNTNLTFSNNVNSNILCDNAGTCLYTFLVPFIAVFGIIGNIVSFKIFVCTSFRRQASTIYLSALNISDTGFLIALFFSWLGDGRLGISFGHSIVYCYFVVYVTYVCSFLSVWYVVLIMIERYVVVCHPLRVQTWCSRRRCYIGVIFITIFSMILYSQAFATSTVHENECSIVPDHMGVVITFTYIDTVITFIFPVVTVFILNVIVLVSIKKFKQKQMLLTFLEENQHTPRPTSTLSTAEYRITSMLIVVSTMFLVTTLPSHAIRLYIMINQLLEREPHSVNIIGQVQHICNLLYYCNFAINFLLYSSSSKIFRKFLCLTSCHSISSTKGRPDLKQHYYAYTGKIGVGGQHVIFQMKRLL